MKLREWLNRNAALVGILATGIVVGSLAFIVYGISSPEAGLGDATYFYDLGSAADKPMDRLFVVRNQLPPIKPPSGKTQPDGTPGGVVAAVFGCGGCGSNNDRFIAFLETYTPAAREAISNPGTPPAADGSSPGELPDPAVVERGHLIRGLEDGNWVPYLSQDGMRLQLAATSRCSQDKPARRCRP
jgi:hypothetical protein